MDDVGVKHGDVRVTKLTRQKILNHNNTRLEGDAFSKGFDICSRKVTFSFLNLEIFFQLG